MNPNPIDPQTQPTSVPEPLVQQPSVPQGTAQPSMTPEVTPNDNPVASPTASTLPDINGQNPAVQSPLPYQVEAEGTPASGSRKKLILVVVAPIAIIAMLALGYFISSKSPIDKAQNNYESSAQGANDTPIEDEDEVAKETRPGKSETPSAASVKSDTGFTLSVTSIVRNFPSDEVDSDEEVILLNVKIETDGTYTGSPGVSDLMVVADSGTTYKKTYAIPEKDLTAGGYTALPSATPKVGGPVSGYVAFAVPYKSNLSKFRYSRPTTKILGGETLPAKSFDANL